SFFQRRCRATMSISKLFTRMKIRTSLILVLVFFLIMLVAGAALGVLSLRANNRALDNIVANQRLGATLYSVIDNYKNVQTILGRAVTSYMVNSDQQSYAIASEWGGTTDASATSALSDESRALIDEARKEYDQSLVRFAGYRELAAKAHDPESRYARVRSEEHTSELQSRENLVCRLLLEKKKRITKQI